VAVVEQLKNTGKLDAAGGPFGVSQHTNAVKSTSNLEGKCLVVLQKFLLREIINVTGDLMNEAYETAADAFEILDKAETKIFKIATQHLGSTYTALPAAIASVMHRIEELKNQDQDITGVPTGYEVLDRITHGWQPTDLVIIAARPSVGKSSFALNLARNAALSKMKKTNVGFFSLEMSISQLVTRILSAESNIWLDKLRSGKLEDYQVKKLYKDGVLALEGAKIYIDDTAALSMFELRAKARRMVLKDGCGLIIIDYLQLLTAAVNKNSNREQEISSISRELKKLAKDLKVPIIALSQLSREIEKRAKGMKIPMLSDLRESGAIEQDADMVMFLYRPPADETTEDATLENTGVLTIKKHRNGALEEIAFEVDNLIQKWTEVGVLK
jgi:replicative DNA helicase